MARKKAVQVPGQPVAKAQAPAEDSQAQNPDDPEVDQDSSPVAEVPTSDLPDASDIDPKTITRAVLTQQGWVCPA